MSLFGDNHLGKGIALLPQGTVPKQSNSEQQNSDITKSHSKLQQSIFVSIEVTEPKLKITLQLLWCFDIYSQRLSFLWICIRDKKLPQYLQRSSTQRWKFCLFASSPPPVQRLAPFGGRGNRYATRCGEVPWKFSNLLMPLPLGQLESAAHFAHAQ